MRVTVTVEVPGGAAALAAAAALHRLAAPAARVPPSAAAFGTDRIERPSVESTGALTGVQRLAAFAQRFGCRPCVALGHVRPRTAATQPVMIARIERTVAWLALYRQVATAHWAPLA